MSFIKGYVDSNQSSVKLKRGAFLRAKILAIKESLSVPEVRLIRKKKKKPSVVDIGNDFKRFI